LVAPTADFLENIESLIKDGIRVSESADGFIPLGIDKLNSGW